MLADSLNAELVRNCVILGGVRERPNRHAWKACEVQASVGSNPTPSAMVTSIELEAMDLALNLAREASNVGEVPVGAVVVWQNRVIARGHNLTERLHDVTAHAEMQAITAASHDLATKYLPDCTLYVTLEPCTMCIGALIHARVTRLVFAARVLPPAHLARQRLADLFLDTLPCNAHTTASDALWAGLPLLTCRGNAFAGRVAASLLRAAGLPELITDDLGAYEAQALRLATTPGELEALKARLKHNRLTHPLFDIDRYRRHLESAYITMVEQQRQGKQPQAFSVQALS